MRKPTTKQKKFVKEYINNGQNATRAAMKAYEVTDPALASAYATSAKNSPAVRNMIEEALAKQDLSVDTIAETIKEGLTAVRYGWSELDKTYYRTDVMDHNTRHKYLTSLIDLLGVKSPEKTQVSITGVLAIAEIEAIKARVIGKK